MFYPTRVILKNLKFQSSLLELHHFAAQHLGSFHSKQRKIEQLPAKKRRFLTVYTSKLDSLMTSKDAEFGQVRKTEHKQVSVHILHFS